MIAQALTANQALAVVENCPYPVLVLDARGQVTGHNRALAHLLEQLWLNSHAASQTLFSASELLQVLIEARGCVSLTEQAGEQHHFEVISFPLPNHDNMQARVFVDVSRQIPLERARAVQKNQLTENTLTDPLTGLLNRRGLMLALEPQVARSRRYSRPMSLIMLSVVVQEYQQPLLIGVAQFLKDQLRWADLIGYTERQEFILVLPETTAEAAVKLADKLEHRLAELIPATSDQRWCFGIVSWRKSDNAATLLGRAAQSLSQTRGKQTACHISS